ncbi:hypothetical protein XELAEV_18012948mg [Xenopus laevis]|uniref:Ig-like domain-containing protein n=1 Tax=Xenopus laevis TaxID=8355 RepID=A0A974DNN2_XENLA|nr:hypothetical protein XELAEV_18012948mg [Xenopus laevis]
MAYTAYSHRHATFCCRINRLTASTCQLENLQQSYLKGCCFLLPKITEPPKNSSWQVRLKAAIDLQCSATIRMISKDIVEMYWLIDRNFTYNYENIREGNMTNTTRGELLYLHSVLHILEVQPENYNIPITCVVSCTSGGDTSTVYLISSGHVKKTSFFVFLFLFLLWLIY